MKAVLICIDSISEWSGKVVCWLCPIIVLVIVIEVISRYVFNEPTFWAFETSLMLGITFYAWGWAYVHKQNAHIRVDVLYERMSIRARATIDVISTLLFFSVLILLIKQSFFMAWRAWEIKERLLLGVWFPPAAPARTVVAIAFCAFALQVVAGFIRDLYLLIRNRAL